MIVIHIMPCTDMVVLNVDVIWGRYLCTLVRVPARVDDDELRIR